MNMFKIAYKHDTEHDIAQKLCQNKLKYLL